ncbi:alpha/beta hydrolase-fold protein [uncultured Tenacibaculum sp.]|uniref:alpha/beta hydrolase-fold protein n=1 Tax=uncultured Tenacibaculum sp. TaxID=174713 RepID=UPI00262D7CE3|nr:alpha/beta hydrolase-fold protein [uncultured Tenacibaculum sp.]
MTIIFLHLSLTFKQMMKHAILILTLICTFHSYSQIEESKITIGTNYTIKSSVLNQDREIQVYLPESYNTTKEKYPVLYVLDGQWFFANGVAIQKSLRTPGAIPEMIIVGIKTKNPLRRTLFNKERAKFTSFLKKEVIGFIDTKFRTTNERVIYGWEAAAYYISKLILEEKDLFQGAIITDGGLAPEKTVKDFKSDKDVYLYIANSKRDIYYIASTEKFNERLKKYNPKNLIWKYELFNEEVHETMPHLAMYKGIMYYYHNYDSLVFESIEAYKKVGGIPYLKSFFKERAKRFGGDEKIDDSTKNSLIWLAWKRDNFKYFSFFMEEFKGVLETKRYDSAYWKNRLGQFYLKHKDYKNAVIFFEKGIKKYPNSQFDKAMREGVKKSKNNL